MRRIELLLLCPLALAPACGQGRASQERWDHPSDVELPPLPVEPGSWPPSVPYRELQVTASPGTVLAEGDVLWVPTGHGVRRVDLGSGAQVEIVTPGWAQQVIRVSSTRLWVADGQAGLALIKDGPAPKLLSSIPLGRVRALASCGDGALALMRRGALLVLQPDQEGRPEVRSQLALDGTARSLSVHEQEGGCRWIVALNEGGAVQGSGGAGQPLTSVFPSEQRAYALGVGVGATLSIVSQPTGKLVVEPARPHGDLSTWARTIWIDGEEQPWFAASAAGVFRGLPPVDTSPEPLRAREGIDALALAPAPGGPWVSWSDGTLEQLRPDGSVARSVSLGDVRSIQAVNDGLLLSMEGGETSVEPLQRGGRTPLLSERGSLAWLDGRPVVNIPERGVFELDTSGPQPALKEVAEGSFFAVAQGSTGAIWVTERTDGLRRLGSGDPPRPDWTTSVNVLPEGLGAGEGWVVGLAYHPGGFIAVSEDGSEKVRALLPGWGGDVLIRDGQAVVAVTQWGLVSVPLGHEPWPKWRSLRLPTDRFSHAKDLQICPTPSGLLVTLGERGIGEVRIDEEGTLHLERIIQTPGLAHDCAATSEAGRYLVADGTGLLEIRL